MKSTAEAIETLRDALHRLALDVAIALTSGAIRVLKGRSK